jgi:Zn-dependent peptidase ImmA (M78 family)
MKVTRLDLDGTGSPFGLVTRILKLEPDLKIPVSIVELAQQLEIERVEELETDAFEGGLLTDEGRSTGIILVNKAARGGRRRFTIGHELAHFLILSHAPVEPGRFLCSRADMQRWDAKQSDRYKRMEVEANQFAALILMPPPALRKFIEGKRDPNLSHVLDLAELFDVSKEAAARAYAEYHEELVAVVVVQNNKVLRVHRRSNFPRTSVTRGDDVPSGSFFRRSRSHQVRKPSDVIDTLAGIWLDLEFGKAAPALFEQVYLQANGFALIMLWAELAEEDEEDRDSDRTAKQRLQDRLAKYAR